MKMKIIFEESTDDIGKGWSSIFEMSEIETAEDALYAFGRATKEIFNWDGLEATQRYNHHTTGERMVNKFNSEF